MANWLRLSVILTIEVSFIMTCQAQDNTPKPTEPEQLVMAKAVRGEPVIFPTDSDPRKRTIRSRFIESLLTGSYKKVGLDRRGFTIANAIFDGPLNLRGVAVQVEVRCSHCRFDKSVDFSESHFAAPLVLDGSEFTDPTATLNFNGMTVDANFSLDNAQIAGDAQFYHLKVTGDLFARSIEFTKPNSSVEFGQAEVKGKMFFEDSKFLGSLSLSDTRMLGLDLKRAMIQKGLDLSHAQIQTVFNLGLSHPPQSVALEGLTYADLTSRDVGGQLIDLIDKASYNAQSYTQLESYYRTHAYPELAEETFFRMKRQERKRLSPAGYLYSLLLYILVGYGRSPQNALYISFVVVLLGAFIFRDKRNVVPRKSEDAAKVFRPFWYSFDLLTPFIDLHEADSWMPRQGWLFGNTYAHVHRIIGWILVPVGIAAITGIIK